MKSPQQTINESIKSKATAQKALDLAKKHYPKTLKKLETT